MFEDDNDPDSDFVVQAKITPGNVPDAVPLPELAQPQARELTGDKPYDPKTKRLPARNCWRNIHSP